MQYVGQFQADHSSLPGLFTNFDTLAILARNALGFFPVSDVALDRRRPDRQRRRLRLLQTLRRIRGPLIVSAPQHDPAGSGKRPSPTWSLSPYHPIQERVEFVGVGQKINHDHQGNRD